MPGWDSHSPKKQDGDRIIHWEGTDGKNQFNVVNLSSHLLTEAEESVLALGLSFCPQQNVNTYELVKDIRLFIRKLLFKSTYQKSTPSERINDLQNSLSGEFVSNSQPQHPTSDVSAINLISLI